MASSTPGTVARERPDSLDAQFRFTDVLQQASPGPHTYVTLLGLDAYDTPGLLHTIQAGLPYRALEQLQENTLLPLDRIAALVAIPRRTLARRKREGRLSPEESDRLVRTSRVIADCLSLFEDDRSTAMEWLSTPQLALGGGRPLDLACSELGAREVEALIGRLSHGVFS